MKSYSFTIKFKDEIGYFSQSQVISDIKDLVIYNGFILGRNVKSVKKIKYSHYFFCLLYLNLINSFKSFLNKIALSENILPLIIVKYIGFIIFYICNRVNHRRVLICF